MRASRFSRKLPPPSTITSYNAENGEGGACWRAASWSSAAAHTGAAVPPDWMDVQPVRSSFTPSQAADGQNCQRPDGG